MPPLYPRIFVASAPRGREHTNDGRLSHGSGIRTRRPPMRRALFLWAAALAPVVAAAADPAESAAQRTPPVYTAALAPDGKLLATSFAFIDSGGGPVTLRDLAAGKERFVAKGHTDAVNTMT